MTNKIRLITLLTGIVFLLALSSCAYIEYKIYKNNQSDVIVIAHAGGKIDGKMYTNSLEAMELSYSQGARYIELDINQTKDGHYVATHDWEKWQQQTGYKGQLPPTLDEFRQYKIEGKYQPLTFKEINPWFAGHRDAVLITDKVDNPYDIVAIFTDKNRLMMELFSEKSLLEAKTVFDGAMANFGAFEKVSRSLLDKTVFVTRIPFLKENGIQVIVTGKPGSLRKKLKLKILRAFDIKIYMYLSGSDEEIEAQVIKYRDYLDGVYYNRIPL